MKDTKDTVLKSGSTFQVITNEQNKNFNRAFYMSYKKSDKLNYAGKYGTLYYKNGNSDVYNVTLKAVNDVKIASRHNSASTFADLYTNNKEFREAFIKSNNAFLKDQGGKHRRRDNVMHVALGEMTKKQLMNEGYDAFNITLVNHDKNGIKAANIFYKEMQKRGYQGIVDVNDAVYSSYKTKRPTIIFDIGSDIVIDNTQKMTKQKAGNINKMMLIYDGVQTFANPISVLARV